MNAKRIDPKVITVWAIVIIMLSGILVTYNYVLRNRMEYHSERPAFMGKLEKDLTALNRTGEKVSLGTLRDKIWVAGNLFTDCPKQCIGVAQKMAELQKKFGKDDRFHLVSISVNPAGDTPEKMDAFVKAHGIDAPNWWFLTGDEEEIRDYMVSYFRFFPVTQNTDPESIATQGAFQHDSRLALVDGKGNIRGYYDVLDARVGGEWEKKLLGDLEWLLAERDAGAGSESGEGRE